MPQEVTLTLVAASIPESTDPGLCRMSADFYQPDGSPSRRMEIRLDLPCGPVVAGAGWFGGLSIYQTDKNGHFQVDLVRGLTYRISFGTRSDISFDFVVPDLAGAPLLDYVVPHVSSVELEEVSYTVEEDEALSVRVMALFSNGESAVVTSAVTLVSSDTNILAVEGNQLLALAVGSAEVSIQSVDEARLPVRYSMLETELIVLPIPTYSIGPPSTVDVV